MHRYGAMVLGGSLTACEAILATWFADVANHRAVVLEAAAA